MSVVCDTSPLILLAKIGRLELLSSLYGEVAVPTAVLAEIDAKPGKDAEKIRAQLQSQAFFLRDAPHTVLQESPPELGAGEHAAIALALAMGAALVILDDQEGRAVARKQGLRVTGTLGVLVEARARGLISSIRPELDRLVEVGMWVNEGFYHRLLSEFGE